MNVYFWHKADIQFFDGGGNQNNSLEPLPRAVLGFSIFNIPTNVPTNLLYLDI